MEQQQEAINLYQFPMGKVKTRVLLQLTMELNKYQFPMGKVKSLTQLNNKYLDLYQFPMGKVKEIADRYPW